MEPFSLLPFLQTLLRADLNQKNDGAQTVENSPEPKNTPSQNPPSSYKEEPPNACLQFFTLHDERVKRTKKP